MVFYRRRNQPTRLWTSLLLRIGKYFWSWNSFARSLQHSDHGSNPGNDQYCGKDAKHDLASSSFTIFCCKPVLFFCFCFLAHINLVQDKVLAHAMTIKMTTIRYQTLSFTDNYFPIHLFQVSYLHKRRVILNFWGGSHLGRIIPDFH